MVIDTRGYGIEQRGFSGIAATGDDGYPAPDRHTTHTANFNLVIWCRAKRNSTRKRQIGRLGTRKNAAIGNKSAVVTLCEPRADVRLFGRKCDGLIELYDVELRDKHIHSGGKVAAKHLNCFSEFSFGQLYLHPDAQTHFRRTGNVIVQQIYRVSASADIILLQTKSKIRRVAYKHLSSRLVDIILSVFVIGTGAVIKSGIQFVNIRYKSTQAIIRRGFCNNIKAQLFNGDAPCERRFTVCQFVSIGDFAGYVLMPIYRIILNFRILIGIGKHKD